MEGYGFVYSLKTINHLFCVCVCVSVRGQSATWPGTELRSSGMAASAPPTVPFTAPQDFVLWISCSLGWPRSSDPPASAFTSARILCLLSLSLSGDLDHLRLFASHRSDVSYCLFFRPPPSALSPVPFSQWRLTFLGS